MSLLRKPLVFIEFLKSLNPESSLNGFTRKSFHLRKKCHGMNVIIGRALSTSASTGSNGVVDVAEQNKVTPSSLPPLTDNFGRHHSYLRISLTERCNLRFPTKTDLPSSFHRHPKELIFHVNSSYKRQFMSPHSLSNRYSLQTRNYCNNFKKLSHIDEHGKAKMVDITRKQITEREAKARAIVDVGPQIVQLIRDNSMTKGDVLTVAEIAGIIGAKRTSDIIPLCHNIHLNSVKVNATLLNNQVILTATVRCTGPTGVEMEALTAVSIAALTIYDMCKAVSHNIIIKDVRLLSKTGGKENFQHED